MHDHFPGSKLRVSPIPLPLRIFVPPRICPGRMLHAKPCTQVSSSDVLIITVYITINCTTEKLPVPLEALTGRVRYLRRFGLDFGLRVG